MDNLSERPPVSCQTGEVERLVASVLVDACTQAVNLVAVIENGEGWSVYIRTEERRLKVFHLAPGNRAAMRAAIKQAVEAS